MSNYYARNARDLEFDTTIRDTIKDCESKKHMALFLQGQEQLNLLRELVTEQKAMREDVSAIGTLVSRLPELYEDYDMRINGEDLCNIYTETTMRFEKKLDELMQYLREDMDKTEEDVFREDAMALVHIMSKRAEQNWMNEPTMANERRMNLWKYVACCVACKEGENE